jgi:hypothetical protein
LIVLELLEGNAFDVFRIVRTDESDDPVLLNSFRSNYELGGEPRRVERSSTVIHMGISVYTDGDVARETAERFPKLGDFIARLDLQPGHGFNYSPTGHPLHLTMWGDPVKLAAAVADIYPV